MTDITTVCSRITTAWGTVNNTVSSTKRRSEGDLEKRAGQDGSTGFWLDTSSFVSFAEGLAYGFDAGYTAIMDGDPTALENIAKGGDDITYLSLIHI